MSRDGSNWVFRVAAASKSSGVEISLPASNVDKQSEVDGQCKAAKLLLCQLAFAYYFNEPVLVVGKTSFKSHTIALFAHMIDLNEGKLPAHTSIPSHLWRYQPT